jgi:hypothetical protein
MWVGRVSGVCLILASLCLCAAAVAATGQPLTKARYDAKATAICSKARRSLDAVPQPSPGDDKSLATNLTAGAKIESAEVAALKKLRPPVTLATVVRQGLAAKAKQIAIIRSAAHKASSGTLSFQQIMSTLIAMPQDGATRRKAGAAVCQY